MKIRLILTFILLAVDISFLSAKDYKYLTVKGDPMQVRIYTLDNGLKVYMSVNKEKTRLQTYIGIRTGSRNDPAETTGLAHYLEHLMFKGTQRFGTANYEKEKPYLDEIEQRYEKYRLLKDTELRKKAYHEIDSISQLAAQYNIPNEYDKLMSSIGSQGSNAFTSNDITSYVEDIPSNEIEKWAKIQADRFQNMVIRGFHTELEAVYEEYNIGLTQDRNKEWQAMNAKLFPNHPYGTQTTIGTQEHLKNPSITNIKNYFKHYYAPNNTIISLAGDFEPDKTIAIIDKYFGSWKRNNSLSRPEYPAVKEITTPVDTTVIGLEAENIMMGWKTKGDASFQADTLNIIADMLVNSKCGLMDRNLNLPMKVMNSVAYYEGLTDYGTFKIIAIPKQGQTLEEVKALILQEIEKLRKGDFADDLVQSVVNNLKLQYNKSLLDNDFRAMEMTMAFINGQKWEDRVQRFDRAAGITKQQIVDFANRFFRNNYVTVFKKQGEDKTQKKIEKPAITPIPANRNMTSEFLKAISQEHVAPIKPQFLDFNRDLVFTKTKKNLPVIYKHNSQDELFTLAYHYEFGSQADNKLGIAIEYLDYIGTDKQSANDIKQAFYKIACDYGINVAGKNITISLSGLNENLPQAIALLDNLLKNAKADKEAWEQYKGIVKKSRKDAMKDQRQYFSALRSYGMYGAYNPIRNVPSNKELDALSPETLVNIIHSLLDYTHTVHYFGPSTENQLTALLNKEHKTAKKMLPPMPNKEYKEELTGTNEVWIAPYDAKNIYMSMLHNNGRTWKQEEAAVSALFNEYFGASMNSVVFQELRETRGLAYQASAYYNDAPLKNHPETAYTLIISQNDKMPECIKVFNNIIDTIPQSESAFSLAKQSLQKQLESRRVTRMGVFSAYLNAQQRGISYDVNELIYKQLPYVTLQDIVNFERLVMAQKPYRYIILGDEKNLDMKVLERIAPIKRLSTKEIFGF